MVTCQAFLHRPKFSGLANVPETKYQSMHVITAFIFTACVAKRAKIMFSQVFVILSLNGGGGGRWATSMVNHLPPGTRSEHLPPPPLGPGHNTSPRTSAPTPPPLWDQVTTPPLPPTPSLGPGHNTSLSPPLGPGHNISPPPGTRSQHLPPWTTAPTPTPPPSGTRSQHLPPPLWTTAPTPPLGPGHNTSPLPPYGQWAGGTHPTGMHSCSNIIFSTIECSLNIFSEFAEFND